MGLVVSVAMCTYNGAGFLREQLASIAGQQRLPDELVICDDQSTDGTVEIIENFAKHASFPVRLHINEKNLRSTKNFEKAIGLCRGDIIALADQDDVWHGDKLARIEDVFLKDPLVGAVFSDAHVVDQHLNSLGYRLWEVVEFDGPKNGHGPQTLFDALLKKNIVTGATMAFRSEFVPRISPIPDIWVHDGWIALVIAALAPVVAIDQPLIMYRQHAMNQIGAMMAGFQDKIRKAKASASLYAALVEQYEYASDWIRREIGCKKEVGRKLEEKVRHLRVRAELENKPKLARLPTIAQEVLARRYHRYSNGWRSVARDIALL